MRPIPIIIFLTVVMTSTIGHCIPKATVEMQCVVRAGVHQWMDVQ